MTQPPAYPAERKLQRFFAMKFLRLLVKTAAAQTIGTDGCWLLTIVVTTEDKTRYRRGVTFYNEQLNLRTQLERIIKRAGLKPWPKMFQNLRASRATELAKQYPAHVATEWLGHSREIAAEHYWRVTDADYEQALQGDAPGGAKGGSVHVTQGTTTNDKGDDLPENCRAESFPVVGSVHMETPPAGLEPAT